MAASGRTSAAGAAQPHGIVVGNRDQIVVEVKQ